MPVIMDVAVVAIIALGVILGARKGLVKSLAGLVIVAVALLGAGVIASALADPVTERIVPQIEERINDELESLVKEQLADSVGELLEASAAELGETIESLLKDGQLQLSDLGEPIKELVESGQMQISELGEYLAGMLESGQLQISDLKEQVQSVLANNRLSLTDIPVDSAMLEDAMEQLGLDESVRKDLSDRIEKIMEESGDASVGSIIRGVIRGLVYGLLYIVAFVILLILLNVIVKALDLLMKLPVLKSFNGLGGALIGFAESVLLIFVALWLVSAMGLFFETESMAETYVFRFFAAALR